MRHFRITVPDRLIERRNAASVGACLLLLSLLMPPGLAENTKDLPAVGSESPPAGGTPAASQALTHKN